MGLRAVSLRALGECRRTLGLGCRAGNGTGGLRARAGCVHRRRAGRLWRQCGMVCTGSTGSLCAVVPRERSVCDPGQHQQYHGERHSGDQRLPHDHHQQHHEYHQHHLRQPERSGRRDGGSAARIRERATCGESGGHGERTADRGCVTERTRGRCSHARKRAGREGRECGSCGRSSGSDREPAGSGQEDAASAASTVCETATGSGSASRATVSEKRSADAAAGERGGGATDGEASTSEQSGDAEYGSSSQPAGKRCAARTTCPGGESTDESARESTGCERASRCGRAGGTESCARRTAEGTSACATESSGNESAEQSAGSEPSAGNGAESTSAQPA